MPLDPMIVTTGDPAGIGPEVTHKAISRLIRRRKILKRRPILVVGDAHLFARQLTHPSEMHKYHILPAEDSLGALDHYLDDFRPAKGHAWRPIFLDCGAPDDGKIKLGREHKSSGERAALYLDVAVEIMLSGFSSTLCTAPICKAAAQKAGFDFAGQTEFLGESMGVPNPVMMLVGGGLRVSLVTIHEPLARVPKLITAKAIDHTVVVTARALAANFGIARPRIAVCGLNPHAGEGGAFGREEQLVIAPALAGLRKQGFDVTGPVAADSAYALALRGQFDAVVAMYHDQGLVAVKTLAFESGVNLTLGLPVIRTAPDHGTAFDIAGKRKANDGAMLCALVTAHELSKQRRLATRSRVKA